MSKLNFLICILFLISVPKAFGQLNASLLGNAVNQGDNCYLITPDLNDQYGAIWYENVIDFSTDFEIVFDAYFGTNDADGADGMALVFKTTATPELGGLGGQIGYGGISSSLAVEFDTWQNPELNDPIDDHIGLMINGVSNHNSGLAIAQFPNLENGLTHEIKFSWNAATKKITIAKDCTEIISYAGDIVDLALNGNSNAYFGFTGSTGGAKNEQRICFKYISFVESIQDQDLCKGSTIDTLDATFSGATSYSWTPTSGINDPTIPNPIFSPTTTTTYEVTITEKCGNVYTESFTIVVHDNPVALTPKNEKSCGDTSGMVQFDLAVKDNEIRNGQSGVSISYYNTQVDADAGNAPLSSPLETGSTTIFVRVENDVNTNCFTTSSFDIKVYDSVFPADALNIVPIQDCDNTSVGTDTDGFIVFDLTQRQTEILNGNSLSDFTLSYFTDLGHINQIPDPTVFRNSISGGQTIYVRMTNILYNNCYADTTFDIEVYKLPESNTPSIYSQCDDASNDGQAFFNLELVNIKEEINPNYIADGLTFTFYEDQNEAENNGVSIPNPENYQDALGFATETVWVRVENSSRCFRVVPLILEVSPSGTALDIYNPKSIFQCDDGIDVRDGVSTFDLATIKNEIISTVFASVNVTVHFYESQLDAELETNEILNLTSHQNTNSPNTQDIWIRVKSDSGNNCLGLKGFQNLLNVEGLPVANLVSTQTACDNDVNINDGMYSFDTSLIESLVLNGQSLANVTVLYSYLDVDGVAEIHVNNLPNPLLTQSQLIDVRVVNNNTSDPDGACYDETSIQFIVDDQPIANPVPAQIVCDGDAGDVDNDGVYPFDTSSFISSIRGDQRDVEIYYDYIDENGSLIIDSTSLPNPLISNSQTISVDVVNSINTNCVATTTIDLVVNFLPDFSIETPQIVCSSDSAFTIVLDPLEANPSEVYTYEWADENGGFLSKNATLPVSTSGIYFVTLTNIDGTGCSKTKTIFVDNSELAKITQEDITITDISNNNTITINKTHLGLGDYEYALDDEFSFYQDEPFFDYVNGGVHTLYVRDKNGCGTASIEISVINYPKFFTPNGDGYHDFWQIEGINSDYQPSSDIYIFNRYGKLIKQLNPTSSGWNGTFNGVLLSNDDYWFRVLLQDGREFIGHFTLKR